MEIRRILSTYFVVNTTLGKLEYGCFDRRIVQAFIGGDVHLKTNGSESYYVLMWHMVKNPTINVSV